MKLSAIFLSLLVVFIWGVNPAISKLGLQELPPFTFLTIRYAIIALLFLPFAKPTKKELGQLFFVAITSNVITNMLGYIAYKELSPSARQWGSLQKDSPKDCLPLVLKRLRPSAEENRRHKRN
jgi:drug/metabolite transporter (DMT)-like permease